MKKIALALTIISILALTPVVYAKDNEGEGKVEHYRFELNSQNQTEAEDEQEQDENEFHFRGQIGSVTPDSFVINGTTILIDPSKVDEFKQKGILNDGDWVKVEGEIIDEGYYAEEIMTIGEGQGRFQIKIDSDSEDEEEDISPTPTESVTPTPSESVTPTPTPTESVSPTPTPTETSNVQVEVKANGPIALVTEFLQQVLSYLEGLVS